MGRDSKEELLKEIEENNTLLGIKALGEYRRNGVVVKTERADTGFTYDRKLTLSDGTSVIAWI